MPSDRPTNIDLTAFDESKLRRANALLVEGTRATTGVAFFQHCVQAIAQTLGMPYVLLSRQSPDDPETGQILAGWGKGEFIETFEFLLEGTPCGEVFDDRKDVCFHPLVNEQFKNAEMLRDMGVESYLGVPVLCSSGECIGVLAVMNTNRIVGTLPEDITLILHVFAARAGAEIERMDAETALEKQVKQALLLEGISNSIRSSLKTSEVLKRATREVGAAFGASRCVIYDFTGQPETDVLAEFRRPGVLPLGERVLCCKPEHFPQVLDSDSVNMFDVDDSGPNPLEPYGVKRMLIARTSHQGRPNGILSVHQCENVRAWSHDEIVLFSQVAAQVGIALSQADLLERERQRLEELTAANGQLVEAAKLKDTFLAAMSHELRTPLNAILGFCEGLDNEAFGHVNDAQRSAFASIDESGKHLLSLINDVLDLSRIGANKLELDLEPTDIESLCQTCIRMARHTALEKGVKLSLKLAPNLPSTMVLDPLRFKQVLVNLLSNAVKFTPSGGSASLEVCTGPRRSEIEFVVSDTGIGIDKKNLDVLFQPFMQLDNSLSRLHSGTGLGLSLVDHLVKLHGGSIKVESTPEVGSVFRIRMQRRECSAVPLAEKPLKPEIAASNLALLQKKNLTGQILLVDDNRSNIDSTRQFLSSYGFTVDVALDGPTAIQRVQDHLPDLILMDIQMPGMDGLETSRLIRKIPTTRNLPIIALTALAMSEDRDRILNAGMDGYVSKPVSLKELITLILGYLESGRKKQGA